MPLLEPPLVRQVNLDERVWERVNGAHKQGWLRPGDIVVLVEEYAGWYRIDAEESIADELEPASASYPEHWVKDNDLGLFGPVDPTPPVEEPVGCLAGLWQLVSDFLEGLL